MVTEPHGPGQKFMYFYNLEVERDSFIKMISMTEIKKKKFKVLGN